MIYLAVQVLIGIVVLVAGHRLFWVFVAAAGFLVGSSVAEQLWPTLSPLALFGAACGTGLVGIIVALVAQKLAIALAGFAIGTYTLAAILMAFGLNSTAWGWLAIVIGGIGGGLLAFTVFDFALIILSSLGGAFLIIDVLQPNYPLRLIVFIVLFSIGIAVQTLQSRQSKTSRSTPRSAS
jgi:hypothetical protein